MERYNKNEHAWTVQRKSLFAGSRTITNKHHNLKIKNKQANSNRESATAEIPQKPGICMVPNQLMLLILLTNISYLLFFLIQNLNIFPFILPSPYFIVVFLVFQFHWYTAIQLYITQPYRRIGKCSNIFKIAAF